MTRVKLENIKIRQDIEDSKILEIACQKFKLPLKMVEDFKILKKSIDARDKNDIFYNYSIIVTLNNRFDANGLNKSKDIVIIEESDYKEHKIQVNRKSDARPVIIGAGPAGLFCAITLIENGVKPIIVEQGKTVEERKKDVDKFLQEGNLNTWSNVQFGEGGAGTFSDGKLTTNLHSPLCRYVLETFVKFGAPEQITYINKP
ncbi:MAG: FAD-binding protein, partial [Clostridia bacterium]